MNAKLLSFKSIALFCFTMLFMATLVAQNYSTPVVDKDKAPDVVIKSSYVISSDAMPNASTVQTSEIEITQTGATTTNQTEITDESTPYYTVNEMPAYIDGKGELPNYIAKTARYPIAANHDKAQGIVVVQVIVEKDGSISNPQVVTSVHPALDEEALRVVGTVKEFIPGKQGGEPVRCYYQIPVPFILSK